jgi:PhoPQ-activated pathogenicity-related protein
MDPHSRRAGLAVTVTAVIATVISAARPSETQTALDRYIASRDSSYGWKLVGTVPGDGWQAFVLELTSQTWRSGAEVDRPVWTHWLTIVRPNNLKTNRGLLFIGGGNNLDPAPAAPPDRALGVAVDTGTVVAELGMVPNQPLRFSDSKDKGRYEDDLVAYSRIKQIETGDDTWLVRLAMVKSAVRALDAIQEFMRSEGGGGIRVDEFVVAGGSKRGWTAWLTAAVDARVIAIMPAVIDALNSQAITRHHYEAYGFFSPALKDYVNHKLFPDRIGTPEYKRILDIEDPYNYRSRERLKIPKYLVNASGDEYFLPDNSRYYYGDLKGEKYLRYVPNTRHNLRGTDARESMTAFYQSVIDKRTRPAFSWKKEKDGALIVTTRDPPVEVNLWQATNPKARDFRVDSIGMSWSREMLKPERPGVYAGRIQKPATGFTAFFVELVYPSGGKYPFKFTTEVSVLPDVLPYRFEDALRGAAK